MTLRQTAENLLIDLDRDVSSRSVRVVNAMDGGELHFAVTLRRGGFFGSLTGHREGRWPRKWTVDEDQLAAASVGALTFDPEPPDSRALVARILDVPLERLGQMAIRGPADPQALDQLARRESQPLPSGCRELLLVTDGLRVGATAVLGSEDLYAPDLDPAARAWLVGIRDAQTYIVACDSGVYALSEPRADLSERSRIASTYVEWIRSALD